MVKDGFSRPKNSTSTGSVVSLGLCTVALILSDTGETPIAPSAGEGLLVTTEGISTVQPSVMVKAMSCVPRHVLNVTSVSVTVISMKVCSSSLGFPEFPQSICHVKASHGYAPVWLCWSAL